MRQRSLPESRFGLPHWGLRGVHSPTGGAVPLGLEPCHARRPRYAHQARAGSSAVSSANERALRDLGESASQTPAVVLAPPLWQGPRHALCATWVGGRARGRMRGVPARGPRARSASRALAERGVLRRGARTVRPAPRVALAARSEHGSARGVRHGARRSSADRHGQTDPAAEPEPSASAWRFDRGERSRKQHSTELTCGFRGARARSLCGANTERSPAHA